MNTKNLKPFDLEAALSGEPVMLRDGSKAFVRHHETEQVVDEDSRLWGIVLSEWNACPAASWTTQGAWRYEGGEHELDIIGMYPKTRIINGFEVPAPEEVEPAEGSVYYIPILHIINYYSANQWVGGAMEEIEQRLHRGLVFLRIEDAIANAKAMLGINPYEESEE